MHWLQMSIGLSRAEPQPLPCPAVLHGMCQGWGLHQTHTCGQRAVNKTPKGTQPAPGRSENIHTTSDHGRNSCAANGSALCSSARVLPTDENNISTDKADTQALLRKHQALPEARGNQHGN